MKNVARRRFLLSLPFGLATLHGARAEVPRAEQTHATVYVFAVLDLRPHVLQKMFEDQLPGVNVTVFGRFGDFSSALADSPPDAALALAPVLESVERRPDLQGTLAGSDVEQYVVLSEARLEAEQLGRSNIGCIDLVGRKKLPAFVQSVLGLSAEPEITRVTKIEDLLQLLQFRRVDAILIAERFLSELSARSQMTLNILRVPSAKVRRLAIAFPGNRRAIEGPLRALSTDLLQRLGVDAWR